MFSTVWHKLAKLRWPWRWGLKTAGFAFFVLFVLYPHPGLLWRQVGNLLDMDRLIQPDMPAMREINREIDAQLATNHAPEFKVVERFVYSHIKYAYDWYNWGNLDYWPTAGEVWERRREDCDGRAVLAASILRARGYPDAHLVANINHVWVACGTNTLMGAQADTNFKREGGKVKITLPHWHTWLDTLTLLCKFPALRSILIILGALVLLYHPCGNVAGFFAVATVALTGFALVFDWSGLRFSDEVDRVTGSCLGGLLLVALAGLAALTMPKLLGWLARGKISRA